MNATQSEVDFHTNALLDNVHYFQQCITQWVNGKELCTELSRLDILLIKANTDQEVLLIAEKRKAILLFRLKRVATNLSLLYKK